MKTTIEISDPLLQQAKQLAARDGTTLRTLVEQGLRRIVSEKKQVGGFKLRQASFKGEGLQQEVRGANWEKVRELIYAGHGG